MATKVDDSDLRVLMLLHSLRDREEFIREAMRLLTADRIDAAAWSRVRSLGADLAPGHPLFEPESSPDQLSEEYGACTRGGGTRIVMDRRRVDRRDAQRRRVTDRRTDERRAIALPWLGSDRRACERRRVRRRRVDHYV